MVNIHSLAYDSTIKRNALLRVKTACVSLQGTTPSGKEKKPISRAPIVYSSTDMTSGVNRMTERERGPVTARNDGKGSVRVLEVGEHSISTYQ